jgi:hypothetical protein
MAVDFTSPAKACCRRSSCARRRRAVVLTLLVVASLGAAMAHAAVHRIVVTGVHGRRYCELFLVHNSAAGLVADVYNTFGLNTCPEAAWNAIDVTAVARAHHAMVAVRNGPRFWLMDAIHKVRRGPEVRATFGSLRMAEEATLAVGQLRAVPFTVHRVNRATEFDYRRGRRVYELLAPHGALWVMQSFSRQVDLSLTEKALRHLGSRLTLPKGWRYRVLSLRRPLRIVTVRTAAQVLQDNLGDTYSRVR